MLLATALAALVLQTADAGPLSCEGQTQQEMNACAAVRAAQAGDAMQVRFKALLSRMEEDDRSMREDGYLGMSRPLMLKAAQEHWLDYRDQQCSFEGFEFAHGSIQPMVEEECVARMTRLRTKELEAAFTGYGN